MWEIGDTRSPDLNLAKTKKKLTPPGKQLSSPRTEPLYLE